MLQIQEITNKKIWEEFILKHSSGSYPFFQSWNWGEVLKSLHIPMQRLGFFTSVETIHELSLQGVAMLVEINAKRGHYLYLRHGPILIEFETYFDECLSGIKKIAKEKKVSFIRVSRLPKTESITQQYLEKRGFIYSLLQIIDGENCWILDITKPEEELLKQMRKSHRYLIRKGETVISCRPSLQITKSTDLKDLSLFIPLYQDLSKRRNFVPHKELQKEFEMFAKDNNAMLFLAKYDEKIIAGAVIIFAGNQAIYRHGASHSEYKNIPGAYLLLWEAIKEAKKRNKTIFNFFGIAPENAKDHPWNGLTLFKTGFGGEREYYLPTMDLPLNVWYWKNYTIDWISKIRKGY